MFSIRPSEEELKSIYKRAMGTEAKAHVIKWLQVISKHKQLVNIMLLQHKYMRSHFVFTNFMLHFVFTNFMLRHIFVDS